MYVGILLRRYYFISTEQLLEYMYVAFKLLLIFNLSEGAADVSSACNKLYYIIILSLKWTIAKLIYGYDRENI
jgi:hypothetical protein